MLKEKITKSPLCQKLLIISAILFLLSIPLLVITLKFMVIAINFFIASFLYYLYVQMSNVLILEDIDIDTNIDTNIEKDQEELKKGDILLPLIFGLGIPGLLMVIIYMYLIVMKC